MPFKKKTASKMKIVISLKKPKAKIPAGYLKTIKMATPEQIERENIRAMKSNPLD
jgi:hypothetical protein